MIKKEVDYKHVVYFILFVLVMVLAFLVVKPYIISVLVAGVLAFVFFPVYKFINKFVKSKSVSAFLLIIGVLVAFLIPLVILANALLKEAASLFNYLKNYDFASLVPLFNEIFGVDLKIQLSSILKLFTKYLIDLITEFLIKIPEGAVQLFVILFTLYYLLKENDRVVIFIQSILPFKKENREALMKEFKDITYALVYGTLITAILQGLLATIGFYIFNVPNPILLGIVVMITGILPLIGSPVVWIPAGLYLIFIQGNLINGLLLFGYGALFLSLIDNLVKPKIVASKAIVHPVLVVLGVLGGISFFGLFGLFLGPLILVFFVKFLKIYGLEKVNLNK